MVGPAPLALVITVAVAGPDVVLDVGVPVIVPVPVGVTTAVAPPVAVVDVSVRVIDFVTEPLTERETVVNTVAP